MDEAKKKSMQQIIVLVVLLVGLGIAMTFAFGRKPASSPGGATQAAASKPATNMASAGITDEMKRDAGGTTSVPAAGSNVQKLNPNMWKVYAISPPKNPFVQQESWYADTFRRLLPGYPQLAESGFFDKPTEVMPDVNRLFGDDLKFEYIDLNRDFKELNHTLTGESEDGRMDTVLTATEFRPDNIRLTFDADGNLIDKQEAQREKPGNRVPGDTPGGDAPGGMGLPLPGDLITGGGSGGNLGVSGVSIHSGRSSALVTVNGNTQLVSVGDSLPPRYVVTSITGSGVEFKDTETGEKKFVGIKAPEKQDANAPASMMRGMNL